MDIDRISSAAADLGESLFWDAASARLLWIDAWESVIHAYVPESGTTSRADLAQALGGAPIGSIAMSDAGGMIAGVRGGFYHLDPGALSARLVAPVERDRPASNRLNDGK